MNTISMEPFRGTGHLLGCRSNTPSPRICAVVSGSSMTWQAFAPPSMRVARRAGWNSLAFPLQRSTVDDENSPPDSSRIS